VFVIEIAVAIGIPAVAAAIGVIRYLWKKEKCFTILKNKVEQLTKHDVGSLDTHEGFESRLDLIEKVQAKNQIYLKLLLDNAKIKYD